MDKKLFVVFIAIGAAVVTTLIQLWMQSGKLEPVNRRMLWILFGAGVVALGFLVAMAITS
jgi:hypothetical protein